MLITQKYSRGGGTKKRNFNIQNCRQAVVALANECGKNVEFLRPLWNGMDK
jgi:hypothetical protein